MTHESTILTIEAIDALLRAETVARIGYVDRHGRPCIVPITYAYDGDAIYGYSLMGAKIEFMGANPNVCVEFDHVESSNDWCSVIVRGTFEALHGRAADEAVERIRARLDATYVSDARSRDALTFVERTGGVGVAYRIVIHERHGRRTLV